MIVSRNDVRDMTATANAAETLEPAFDQAAKLIAQEYASRPLPVLTSSELAALGRYPHRVRNATRRRFEELRLVQGLGRTVWGETVIDRFSKGERP
jgi:hypothetical protein